MQELLEHLSRCRCPVCLPNTCRRSCLSEAEKRRPNLPSFHTACIGIQCPAVAVPLCYALKQTGCHTSAHRVCAVHKEDLDSKRDDHNRVLEQMTAS